MEDFAYEVQRRLRRNAMWSVLLHSATSAKVGLNASDAQCINLLSMDGPMSPGKLAEAMSLTTGGAITAVIDRLEKAGFVRRTPDPDDRRRVIVEAVPEQVARLARYFEPVSRAAWERVTGYTEDEHRLICRFLDDVYSVMPEVIEQVRALP